MQRVAPALVMAGSLFVTTAAHALWDDALTLFAEEKITHDDNVFRISRDLDPAAAIGSSSRADTYRTLSLGLKLDLPVSLQRFQLDYTHHEDRYSRFTDLDLASHDAHAAWLWHLRNDASGQLAYEERVALASFAYIQTRTPDQFRLRRAFLNGTVLATPRWRAQAGIAGLEQTNSDPARQVSNVRIVDADLALSYITPADNSIGIGVRAEEGRFPNQEFVPGSLFANAYRQLGVGLVGEWAPTGASRISARADRLHRHYDQVPQRDFDGNTFRVQYDWKPTGKLSLAAVVQKDISAYEDIRSSFVLLKGFTLRMMLKATELVDVSGTLEYGVRDYLGDPGLLLADTPTRSDRVRSATLNASYRPAQNVTLQASAQHEVRTSNVQFADYGVNVYFASIRIAF
jgi:exopolysaccharide biosynthesis operon protein EpsL